MLKADRRRACVALLGLVGDHQPVPMGAAAFDDVLAASVRQAACTRLDLSLVLVRSSAAPAEVADVLARNLRSTDVVALLDDGTHAVLIGAERSGALRVADRLRRVLGQVHPGHPSWFGLATATGSSWTADLLLLASSVAIGRAVAHPLGWIEVAPG